KLEWFCKYSKNHSMIKPNSGTNTELCHQSADAAGVKASIKNRIALTTSTPRNAPNTSPNKRSVPDRPVDCTSLPTTKLIRATRTRLQINKIAIADALRRVSSCIEVNKPARCG